MRKIVLCMVGVMGICSCGAQTWAEWTEQKRTQLKYLARAIAANKVYIDYARKGYEILSGGLDLIRSIKDGDFQLHQLFLDELQRVNPAIKIGIPVKFPSLLNDIVRMIAAIERIARDDLLADDERSYVRRFCEAMRKLCEDSLDDFARFVTDGDLSMSDGERVEGLQRLSGEVMEWMKMVRSFAEDLKILLVQKKRLLNEVRVSKILRE